MGEKVTLTDHKQVFSEDQSFVTLYHSQIAELAEVRNPSLAADDLAVKIESLSHEIPPFYAYYPWKNTLVEMIPKEVFLELKTNRNKLLITEEEQRQLFDTHVSIAGMSVGSSLLYGLVGTTIGGSMTLADDDTFSTSNLNRVQATIFDVGQPKVEVATRRALEMNPFIDISAISDRLSETNIGGFFRDGARSIVFEEIDDFRMKLVIREEAKKRGVSVIMLTNLGDSVLIDIERYDTEPDTTLFNGFVDEELLRRIKNEPIDEIMKKQLAVALVDKDLVPERAIQSLAEMGHTLVGRPQLYSTVALDGGLAPYLAREIVLHNSLGSGRYALKLSDIYGDIK